MSERSRRRSEFSAAREKPRSEGNPGPRSGPGSRQSGVFLGYFFARAKKPVFDQQRARCARERARGRRRTESTVNTRRRTGASHNKAGGRTQRVKIRNHRPKPRHCEERSDEATSESGQCAQNLAAPVPDGDYSLRSPFGPACGRSTRFALLCFVAALLAMTAGLFGPPECHSAAFRACTRSRCCRRRQARNAVRLAATRMPSAAKP